jgi:serine/threonine protein kinase
MLTAGRQLGRYQIRSVLGVGGMGEVYLAHDESLGRSVAIKTLPAEIDADRDRIVRFEREARLLASLSHPNIAAVHGFEQADGLRYLVLEHVEGPTLQEKLASGPLELQEALLLARQIALALDGAHVAGIIHRDLKPANIKVKPDDTVKVLDFGLAKVFDPASGAGRSGGAGANEVSNSPTITSGATRDGLLLGTAAYMSPEQARGRSVDKRTDLWAFGCIVYEMLTGRQMFGGETISDSLANVLNREVDWSRLPATTPTPIRRLLRRCLERDGKARLSDASDARLEIDDAIAHREELSRSESTAQRRPKASWVIAASLAGAVAGVLIWVAISTPRTRESVGTVTPVRFEIPLAPQTTLSGQGPAFAIAPDGKSLVVAIVEPVGAFSRRLVLPRLESSAFEPIKGTEDGTRPFFSPDGESLGFVTFTTGEIKLVNLRTGAIRSVCRLESSDVLGAPSVSGDLSRSFTVRRGRTLR